MSGLIELVIFAIIILAFFFIIKSFFPKKRKSSSNLAKEDERKELSAKNVPRRFREGIQGVASRVEKHEVSDGGTGEEDYLSFRLETYDDEGNLKEMIPVEVRAKEISGRIVERDTIVVLGRRNRQGLLIPKGIYNITTQLEITSRKMSFGDVLLMALLIPLNTAAAIGFFVGLIWTIGAAGGSEEMGIPILILVGSSLFLSISIYISKKRRLG